MLVASLIPGNFSRGKVLFMCMTNSEVACVRVCVCVCVCSFSFALSDAVSIVKIVWGHFWCWNQLGALKLSTVWHVV